MTRNLIILVVLVSLSMLLVIRSNESRILFGDLQKAKALERQLDTQYRRLEAIRQRLAKNLEVERAAQARLGMKHVSPDVTEFVRGGSK